MPRPLRIQYPGAVYHVMNRGNGRQPIFEDATDAGRFIDLFGEIARPLGWHCHAYCLMTNHYHLVLQTESANLSKGMQAFAGRYTQDFNRRHARDGQVFRGRFKAILVERDSYLLPLIRYVVLNPVLAKLVDEPGAWRWSSYRATAGKARAPDFLDLSWLIGSYGFAMAPAREAWCAHIAEGLTDREKVLALEKTLRNRSILGGSEFVRAARRRTEASPEKSAKRGQTPFRKKGV
jgi:REP element-mobilizing transposase RayT